MSNTSDLALPRAALYRPSSSSNSQTSSAPPRFTLPAAAPSPVNNPREDARPSKRQKTQACLRCRRRKQKCDNKKPCDNCVKADEQCYAAPTAQPKHASDLEASSVDETTVNPLATLAEISALEERLSRIEQGTRLSESRQGLSVSEVSRIQAEGSPRYSGAAARLTSILGDSPPLSRSTPAVALLAAFAAPAAGQSPNTARESFVQQDMLPGDIESMIDPDTEESLFNVYSDKVHWRYPFLRLHQLRNQRKCSSDPCAAFFISMIYSISLMLERDSASYASKLKQEDFYRIAVTRYLSHVFNQEDHLLHIQAYLMLAMHAVYSPSTERIITITSAAMRYCVMAQLHCADAEPSPVDVASRVRIQIRRRAFWCAYKLDRTVGGIYHLPFAIPDSQITVKMYANVDDAELEERCRDESPNDAMGVARFTNVTAALQVVYCRQIQSEILNTTLHRDFSEHLDRNDRWRQRVLDKLDRWRSLWDQYSDAPSQVLANNDWINMMYSYSLGMLYQPTKTSVLNSAGAWTVKACTQACLIFRKLQRDKSNTELWLGLITQFKCGVALLYTFFATPLQARPAVYEHPDVPEAVRACSITLALVAERWPQSRCIRNTFDILAREVPLFEHGTARGPPTSRRIRQESRDALLRLLKQLEPIVIHRDTLRMIREIATEEFPSQRLTAKTPMGQQALNGEDRFSQQDSFSSTSRQQEVTQDFFQPFTAYNLQLDGPGLDQESLGDTAIEFPAYFDELDYF